MRPAAAQSGHPQNQSGRTFIQPLQRNKIGRFALLSMQSNSAAIARSGPDCFGYFFAAFFFFFFFFFIAMAAIL
jgi:hypothetical protein